jgi:uncharacterized membrane protein YGL010W
MSTIQNLLAEYGESHQNKTNKLVHWICVPAIFFSLIGLIYSIKLPFYLLPDIQLNAAHFVILFVLAYYFKLSKSLTVGLTIFVLICLWLCYIIEEEGLTLWAISLLIFVVAWIGQFWGHKIEGKKPSFLKDLVFLLVGPAWLMSFIYKNLDIKI